jgi:hypothetical protein
MLLCDAAEETNGKLYILGAGWTHVLKPDVPINIALAIVLHVPWEQAGQRHQLEISLLKEDGQPALLDDNPVKVQGSIEVRQPTGVKPGSELDAVTAITFAGISLPAGGYVWQLLVDGELSARRSFWVQSPLAE